MKAFSNWNSFVANKRADAVKIQQNVSVLIAEAGMVYTADAQTHAPVKYGFHKQNIGSRPMSWHRVRMYANAPYAPFLEFGTGEAVDVPEGWHEIAIQFKGRGIKKINLKPHPHIVPAFNKAHKFVKDHLIECVKV